MLFISNQEIDLLLSTDDVIQGLEQAYLKLNDPNTYIPDRMHVHHQNNTLLAMPGFMKNMMGTKLVSVFPDNQSTPTINGLFVLNNPNTGAVIAAMDAAKLTAIRTAGVSALAIKYLTDTPKHLGIIGTSVQALSHAKMVSRSSQISNIHIFGRNVQKAHNLRQAILEWDDRLICSVQESVADLIHASDIIITVTSSEKPLFKMESINPNHKCFIAVGSYKPNMQEFPVDFFNTVHQIFVDTELAKEESGDLKIPLATGVININQIISLDNLINGNIKKSNQTTTFFKSVGMSLFDLAIGDLIYQKAKELNKGQKVIL